MARSATLRNLRLRHLELLATLGEVSTVHAAASRLHLTQPAVSKMLQDIERQSGCILFERSRRGIAPTQAGIAMIRRSRLMLNELAKTEEELDAVHGGAQTLLKIGTLPLTGIVSVLNAVIRLRTEIPGVLVNISEGTVSDLVSELTEGKIDCFIGEVLSSHDLHELKFERLYEDRIYVVASPEHALLRRRTRFAWRDLCTEKWALPPKGGVLRQAFMAAFITEGATPPNGEVECQSSITVGSLCQLDKTLLGILRSEAALHEEALELLRIVPMRSAATLPPLSIVTRKGYGPPPMALATFVDCLKRTAADFKARMKK